MTHNPMSPERRISISLIKVIRRYIDNKYPFEKNMSSKLLDVFVQEIFVEAEDNADFQNKEEKDIFHYISEELSKDIKNIVLRYNEKITDCIKKYYEISIIKYIGEIMEDIENTLKNNFSQEELIEISQVIDKDSVNKFINSFLVVDCIQKHFYKMNLDIQNQFNKEYSDPDLQKNFMKDINSVLEKHGIETDIKNESIEGHGLYPGDEDDFDNFKTDEDQDLE